MILFRRNQYFNALLRRTTFLTGGIAAGSLLLAPGRAIACSVCFNAGGDASLSAYLGTAAFLSLLPFAIVLLLARWFRRRQ